MGNFGSHMMEAITRRRDIADKIAVDSHDFGGERPCKQGNLPFQVDNIRSLQSDVALEGINHWVMVEAKDEVTDIAASWLHA